MEEAKGTDSKSHRNMFAKKNYGHMSSIFFMGDSDEDSEECSDEESDESEDEGKQMEFNVLVNQNYF